MITFMQAVNPSQLRDIVWLKSNWQSGAYLSIFRERDRKDALFPSETVVCKSKLFRIHK